MIDLRKSIVPLAFLAGISCSPALAIGHSSGSLQILQTKQFDLDHPDGVTEGTLNITIGENGSIVGYFRPVDSGRQVNVYGGVDGQDIYLNIAGQPTINGTYQDGKITGYVSGLRDLVEFTAEPASNQST